MKNKLLKMALLSVSMLVTIAPAINANIPMMKEAFSDISLSLVEMITTVPYRIKLKKSVIWKIR